MKAIHYAGLLVVLMLVYGAANGQSTAALERVQQRFDPGQIADMQLHTQYKYQGWLLFYESSFLVIDSGQSRPATEDEIRQVDLDAHSHLRKVDESVTVHDVTLGKEIVLLSRAQFEQVLLTHLSPTDAEAYLAYKAQAISLQGKNKE